MNSTTPPVTRRSAEAALDRASILRRALLLPDSPEFGPIRLRPFSLWTLDLCEELGLDFFLSLPAGVPPAGDRLFQIAALIWFHDFRRPESEIDAHLMRGTWRREAGQYQRAPELAEQLEPLVSYIAFVARMVSAASVRVKQRPRSRSDEKEPATVIEPGTAYALLWSLSGGHLVSREQEHFLYRELPLPRFLSYYHCALRAALMWTVPPGRGRRGTEKRALDQARAAQQALLERDRAAEIDVM